MRFKHNEMAIQVGNKLIQPGEVVEIPDDEDEADRLIGLGFEKLPDPVGRPKKGIRQEKAREKAE